MGSRKTTSAILILLLSLLAALTASAQSVPSAKPVPTVNAILDPRRISEGGQATLSIETVGGPADSLPQTIQARGLAIQFAGHNSSVQIVNGKRTEHYSYIYSVRPAAVGRYVIPAVTVSVGGRSLSTAPQELLVEKAPSGKAQDDNNAPSFLRIELPRTELYVGEVVPVKLTLFVLGRNSISGVGQPKIERENLVIKRFPSSPQSGVIDINGRLYSTVTLETSLFAIDAGQITVGPCTLPAMYYESQEYARVPSIFRRASQGTFRSNTIEVNVKPLPDADRPSDFTGAVGSFRLEHSASPTELKTGDPISVDLQISGVGNFDSLEAPALVEPDGWKLYPARELVQNQSDGVVSGKITYSQVIIPLREHADIPPFRFSYFDPKEEKYITLKSDPVPITISADSDLAVLDPGTETPGHLYPSTEHSKLSPTENLEDILTIKTDLPAFRSQPKTLAQSPAFWAAQSLPALAFLGLLGTGIHRRWKNWETARAMHPRPRSTSEIIASIESGSPSRAALYHDTLACIDAWKEQHPDAKPDRELTQIESVALTFLYGRANANPDRPPTTAESDAVLKTLRHLDT